MDERPRTSRDSDVASLRALLEERDRRYMERFEQERLARDIALASANQRLDSMNELREQINRERNLYATKESVSALERIISASGGVQSGRGATWQILITVLGLVIAAVAVVTSRL